MKKKKGMLWILVTILAVMFVTGCTTKKVTNDSDKKAEETIYVTDMDGISAIKYSVESLEMSFVQKDGKWYYEPDEKIALNQRLVTGLFSDFEKIEALQEIKDAGALSDYGLETPSYTVEITDTKGNVITLYIGNEVDDCYYVTVGNKGVVYTMDNDIVGSLKFDIEILKEIEADLDTEELVEEDEVVESADRTEKIEEPIGKDEETEKPPVEKDHESSEEE